MNYVTPNAEFDRIVPREMFEHISNSLALLPRVFTRTPPKGWAVPLSATRLVGHRCGSDRGAYFATLKAPK